MKLRTGDTVVIITGKDKGKTGTVLRVLPLKNRAIVGGINMRTKHIRRSAQQAGQKIRYEASIHISNLMAVDPKTKKRTRIGWKVDEKGRKVRMARRSGETLTVTRAASKKASVKTTDTEEKTAKPPKGEAGAVDAPKKNPFWKRVGFGKDELEGAEVKEPSRSKEDRSIPGEATGASAHHYQRGV